MKVINIISLLQAKTELSEQNYTAFLDYYSIKISQNELDDIKILIRSMHSLDQRMQIFNGYYVGYTINQISKEFDLLRIGRNYIVNIEIKNDSNVERIKKQLSQNRYYLKNLGKEIFSYTFVSSTNTLYFMDSDENISTINMSDMVGVLQSQELEQLEDINSLFDPSKFLISPFNTTERFLNGEYFLTGNQEQIKTNVLNGINSTGSYLCSICGNAGTGKTLLVYDIAKSSSTDKRVKIIHCGSLNDGQNELNQNGWAISPVKYLTSTNFNELDLLIIDESQRLREHQFSLLIEKANEHNFNLILSYDQSQTLANWESAANIEGKITANTSIKKHKLSEKIRTNKEISNLIKRLFNIKRNNIPNIKREYVDFEYFSSNEIARSFLLSLDDTHWEILRWTPSQYDNEHHKQHSLSFCKTSHEVIGQEFDNVVIVIDSNFYYDDDGKLKYNSKTYYNATKMLFQNITRTRKKLKVVIIKNEQILERCINIIE